MTRRAWIQLLLGVGIAVACLYFFFRNTDFGQLWGALQRAHYLWLIPVFLSTFASLAFRVWRWKYLLYEAKRISLRGLWTPTILGFTGNFLLPARAGEMIRVVALAQRERVPFPTVLASLVMDRLFDMIAVVIVGLLVFSVLPIDLSGLDHYREEFPFTIEQIRSTIGVSMAGSLVLGLTVLLLLYFQRARTERLLEAVLFFIPARWRHSLIGALEHFTDGMHVLRNPRHVGYCLFHTFGVWITITLTFPALFRAFELHELLPWYASLIMVACASLAVLVPTPGFLGAYQIAMVVGLALGNSAISQEAPGAIEAFGIVAWLAMFLTTVSLGLVTLAAEGVSFGALQREAQRAAEAGAEHG